MDIRHLRYLVSAVEGGSLSAAAKRQNVTVQAVSKGIAELEDEVGTPLLVRGSHGVSPTAPGTAFYQHAKETITSFEDLQGFCQTIPTNRPPNSLLSAFCAPPFKDGDRAMGRVASILGKRLGIDLSIIVAPGPAAVESLRSGALDALCTIGTYESDDTDCVVISKLPTGVGMTRTHPLAKHRTVRMADIEPYPVYWNEGLDGYNNSILNEYLKRGAKFNLIKGDNSPTGPHKPSREDAVYFSVYLAPFGKPFSDSRVVPIDKSEAIKIPICLVTMKGAKSEAYLQLERAIGTVFKATSLF